MENFNKIFGNHFFPTLDDLNGNSEEEINTPIYLEGEEEEFEDDKSREWEDYHKQAIQ